MEENKVRAIHHTTLQSEGKLSAKKWNKERYIKQCRLVFLKACDGTDLSMHKTNNKENDIDANKNFNLLYIPNHCNQN